MENLTAREDKADERAEMLQRFKDNAEHITRRCVKCNIATDYNCDEWVEVDVVGSKEFLCGECYLELREESL